eukprot:758780-Hanusia_phi.AAC.2
MKGSGERGGGGSGGDGEEIRRWALEIMEHLRGLVRLQKVELDVMAGLLVLAMVRKQRMLAVHVKTVHTGYGLGGYVIQTLCIHQAQRASRRVKGVVLISSFPVSPASVDTFSWMYKMFCSWGFLHVLFRFRMLSNWISRPYFGRYVNKTMQVRGRKVGIIALQADVLSAGRTEEKFSLLSKAHLGTGSCGRQVLLEELASDSATATHRDFSGVLDLTPDLKKIEVPCLVVCGTDDKFASGLQERFETALSSAKVRGPGAVHWLERMGHMLPWEAPDTLTQLVNEFIKNNA